MCRSQPPPDISTNLPLKTEPLAHQYMFERGLKNSFDTSPGVFPEGQKALDLTKKVEFGEEKFKALNKMYGFDVRNMRNWQRHRDKLLGPDGVRRFDDITNQIPGKARGQWYNTEAFAATQQTPSKSVPPPSSTQ